jgi:anthranilate synthase/aminodeoxychorismate synthase-like glutamine amidotransferase
MSARLLLIDNYDSFTYNLVQGFRALGAEVLVYRNDAIDVETARSLRPTHLVVSPGPGRPEDAGVSMEMIRAFAEAVPVLGVCLGHQSLAAVFGARIVAARTLMHGKTSSIEHDGAGVFSGLPSPLEVGRYHSLAVQDAGLPRELYVSARSEDGEIMGLRHRALPLEGLQFHPESVLTPEGNAIMANFLLTASAARLQESV